MLYSGTHPTCPACAATASTPLGVPVSGRSMISDGRIVSVDLDKLQCLHCGLVRHRRAPSAEMLASFYDDTYALPRLAEAADDARGRAYADVVARLFKERLDGARLLDVGCGSGAMLQALVARMPTLTCLGLDPALPSPSVEHDGRLRLTRGMLPNDCADGQFDIIVSVNTIEHVDDPISFLKDIVDRLAPDGEALIICPVSDPPNHELMFFDHVRTITPVAMIQFARRAGIHIRDRERLAAPLFGFQWFRLKPNAPNDCAAAALPALADCRAYMTAWAALDDYLCSSLDRLGLRVQAFGAGQMAALLRCYAPRAWAMVERAVLDNPQEAWPLAPAIRYEGRETLEGWATLTAVHPASQPAIAKRIMRDGGLALSFHKLIPY